MAYGVILGQKPIIPENPNTIATNVSYNNSTTSSIITGTDVQSAIDQLFTSVSNGKELVANAITDKGVMTSSSDTFATMAENISNISTGTDLSVFSNGKIMSVSSGNTYSFSKGMVLTWYYFQTIDTAYTSIFLCDTKELVQIGKDFPIRYRKFSSETVSYPMYNFGGISSYNITIYNSTNKFYFPGPTSTFVGYYYP